MSADWIRVTEVDAVQPGHGMLVPGTTPPVALFRSDGGDFYAVDDTCTHQQSSLSDEGYVDGEMVICGWHSAGFCLKSGEPQEYPAEMPLATHEVEVRDGEVFVKPAVPAP